jgi:hypothetical protein
MGTHRRRLRPRSQFRLPWLRDHSAHFICGGTHRGTPPPLFFASHPAALLNHRVAKAYAEDTRAVMVTRSRSPLPTGPSPSMPPSSSTRRWPPGPTPAGGLLRLGWTLANFAVDASSGQRGAMLPPDIPAVTRDGWGRDPLGSSPHHQDRHLILARLAQLGWPCVADSDRCGRRRPRTAAAHPPPSPPARLLWTRPPHHLRPVRHPDASLAPTRPRPLDSLFGGRCWLDPASSPTPTWPATCHHPPSNPAGPRAHAPGCGPPQRMLGAAPPG